MLKLMLFLAVVAREQDKKLRRVSELGSKCERERVQESEKVQSAVVSFTSTAAAASTASTFLSTN